MCVHVRLSVLACARVLCVCVCVCMYVFAVARACVVWCVCVYVCMCVSLVVAANMRYVNGSPCVRFANVLNSAKLSENRLRDLI